VSEAATSHRGGRLPVWFGVAVFALLALVPLAGDYWTDQFARYLLYGLFAMSLGLVWGRGGILCLGQAMFFGLGGYLMSAATMGMLGNWLVSSYLGLLVAVAGAGLFAAVLGYFLFWGKGLSGPYLAIVTLAIAYILEQLINSWYALGGANGLSGVPPLNTGVLGGVELWEPVPRFYTLLAIGLVVYVFLERLVASPFGIVLTAVKTNPERAAFFGYRVLWVRLAAFVIGAAVAGLSGALFVATDEFASPTLIGFALSAEVLIWVALGGKEMILAAFLAAIAVRLVEGMLGAILGDYWILALGLVFMISVVLLPRGLLATPLNWVAARTRR